MGLALRQTAQASRSMACRDVDMTVLVGDHGFVYRPSRGVGAGRFGQIRVSFCTCYAWHGEHRSTDC